MKKLIAAALFAVMLLTACTTATTPTGTAGGTATSGSAPTKEKVEATYEYTHLYSNSSFNFYEATATYGGEDHRFIFRVPVVDAYSKNNTSVAEKMDPQIETLGKMAATGVNVWVYMATALEDTELMIDIAPTEYKGSNIKYFEENLSDDVWLGYIKPYDIAEYNEMYFDTDHHWNAAGIKRAYEELVAGLQTKYPDITPRTGEIVVTDAKYYGANARSIALYEFKDTFAYVNYDLPEHETKVLRVNKDDRPSRKDDDGMIYYGSETPWADNVAKYENGTFNKNDNFDHYVNFYPICDVVTYHENTGRNAIFIGDSFSLGMQELVASHFDTTYYFYSDGTVNLFRNVAFNKFCEENSITDVIVIEQSTRLLYDFYDYSGPALCSFRVK